MSIAFHPNNIFIAQHILAPGSKDEELVDNSFANIIEKIQENQERQIYCARRNGGAGGPPRPEVGSGSDDRQQEDEIEAAGEPTAIADQEIGEY